MEPKDLFAVLAFIVIFKMIMSPRLRGRTVADAPDADATESQAQSKAKPVAPMHMPIQIPPAGVPRFDDDEPEKLVIEGPIPGDRDR